MSDNAWIPASSSRLPERIRHLKHTVPGLWWAGDPTLLDRGLRVGIVGSRHPRVDSERHARTIARDLGRFGITVVSGLAIGIDGIAHRASLEGGGDTIAVLAGGLGLVHPSRHRTLAGQLAGARAGDGVAAGAHPDARGLIVTEYGAGREVSYPNRFTERNRIIAALSDYLVVVQARPRSGSMSTVRVALDLGVPVGIVPSAPEDPCYGGSLDLVREGADCVVDGRSVCRRMELHGVVPSGFLARLDGEHGAAHRVHPDLVDHPLASILEVPRQLDEIADLAGMSIRDTRRMLLELEEHQAVSFTDDGAWVADV